MFLRCNEKGQGLVELTIAAGILATILGLVAFMSSVGLRTISDSGVREEATFIAQQGIETVKNFKDRNWGAQEIDSDGNGNLDCPAHETCRNSGGNIGQEPYINNGGGGVFVSAAICKVAAANCEGKFYALGTLPLANPYCTEIRADSAIYLERGTCEFDTATAPNYSSYTRVIRIEDAHNEGAGVGHPSWVLPNIVTNCLAFGAGADCNVRKITVSVFWSGGSETECNTGNRVRCVQLVAYLAKWKEPPQ